MVSKFNPIGSTNPSEKAYLVEIELQNYYEFGSYLPETYNVPMLILCISYFVTTVISLFFLNLTNLYQIWRL